MAVSLEITKFDNNATVAYVETLLLRLDDRFIRISIGYDPNPENPRKVLFNEAEFICFHPNYDLGDEHSYASPQEFREWMNSREARYYLIKELYLYDHSGLIIGLSPFYDPWDSGQVGWVRIDLRKVCKSLYPNKSFGRLRAKDRADVLRLAEAIIDREVEEYNYYLQGRVYFFEIRVWQQIGDKDYRIRDDLDDAVSGCLGEQDLQDSIEYSLINILEHLGVQESELPEIFDRLAEQSRFIGRLTFSVE